MWTLEVVPHGSSIYSYHLQFAFMNAPLGEFINLSPDATEIKPYFGGLFPDEPLPKDHRTIHHNVASIEEL
eukprot:956282-Amphidinium_carterae.4